MPAQLSSKVWKKLATDRISICEAVDFRIYAHILGRLRVVYRTGRFIRHFYLL
jgi:hypothetical protein